MHYTDIRKEILAAHPEFHAVRGRKHPEQLLYGLGWLALIVALSIVLGRRPVSGPTSMILFSAGSGVLGLAYAALGFFTHELMHGTMLRSKKWTLRLAYPGFAIFCLSPRLWDTWHNQLHHFNTNKPGEDPDSIFTIERINAIPHGRKILKYFPGSRHPLSAFFVVSAFSVQVLNVLWLRSRNEPEFAHLYARMDRPRIVRETFFLYGLWILGAILLGPLHFLFILVIPALIANAFIVSYISILHTTRPLSDTNRPLVTTISVRSPRIFDWLFFHFSHHVEHHVFPESNHRYYPAMQRALKNAYAEDYNHLDHGNAIALTFSTPSVYRDREHLFDPDGGRTVDLVGLKRSGFRRAYLREKR